MTVAQAWELIRSSEPWKAAKGDAEMAWHRWSGNNPAEAAALLRYQASRLMLGAAALKPIMLTRYGRGALELASRRMLALVPQEGAAPQPQPVPTPMPMPVPAGPLDPRLPLIKADGSVGDDELRQLARHGYAAINYQAQNGGNPIIDYSADIAAAKAAGLRAGVWGVSYDPADFFRDGKALGQAAVAQKAEHLTMDVESALKNTRPSGAKPIIDGVRAGGWSGPVHLNTLGGPVNPRVTVDGGGNDYGFDYKSFTDTGGGVYLQCYFNMADEYRPKPSVDHAVACSVPRDRINVTISLAHSESSAPKPTNRISGTGWVPLLIEAGVKRNLSIFLARHIEGDADLVPLDWFSLAAS